VRWSHVNRRRLNERTADRTRVRQPLLPTLVEHVSVRWLELCVLLAATTAAAPGEHFIHSGARWQRVATQADQRKNGPLRVLNRDAGQLVHVTVDEDGAFLDWAVVEILRHAGLRIEELLELSHLSIRNYQRTNGEVGTWVTSSPSWASPPAMTTPDAVAAIRRYPGQGTNRDSTRGCTGDDTRRSARRLTHERDL
jgi:hypothetical protein